MLWGLWVSVRWFVLQGSREAGVWLAASPGKSRLNTRWTLLGRKFGRDKLGGNLRVLTGEQKEKKEKQEQDWSQRV